MTQKIDMHKLHDYETDMDHYQVNKRIIRSCWFIFIQLYVQQVQNVEKHKEKARNQAKQEAKKRKKYKKLEELFDNIYDWVNSIKIHYSRPWFKGVTGSSKATYWLFLVVSKSAILDSKTENIKI